MGKTINEMYKNQSTNFKLTLIENERELYSNQIKSAHQQLFIRNPFVRDWFYDFGTIEQSEDKLK